MNKEKEEQSRSHGGPKRGKRARKVRVQRAGKVTVVTQLTT